MKYEIVSIDVKRYVEPISRGMVIDCVPILVEERLEAKLEDVVIPISADCFHFFDLIQVTVSHSNSLMGANQTILLTPTRANFSKYYYPGSKILPYSRLEYKHNPDEAPIDPITERVGYAIITRNGVDIPYDESNDVVFWNLSDKPEDNTLIQE